MKKLISLLLLCAMLAPAVISCSESEVNNETETSGTSGNVTADESVADEVVSEVVTDDLPEKNYDGYSYNIFTRSNTTHYQFLVEEQNAEAVNDAIYLRNENVAERFGIVFTETEYSDQNEPQTLVMAGDQTYSLMNVRCTAANTMAQKNYCIDIDTLEYIDLDKPYWDAELTESIAIGSRTYTAIGATNLTAIDFMNVLLFNKEILNQYNLEDPYALVKEGKWTFDKFGEMGAAVTTETNGDGVYDGQDTWGLLGVSKYTHCALVQAGGALYVHKDEDGYPYYNINTDEYFINVFNKIFEVCNDNNAWYATNDESNEGTEYHTMFRNNQGLFLSTLFYYIESMRDMDSDFGIIPYPKYNEAQSQYLSRVSFFDTAVIPSSVEDVERTSIVFEALTCESHNLVIPAYKNVALEGKYSRDAESVDMLDIILNNRVLDLGDTYLVDSIRDAFLRQMFYNDDRDIVSAAKSRAKLINKTIELMVEAYEGLE